MNFKSLSSLVIQKAEEYQIPLFFTPTVVSFLDLSREISTLILEDQQSEKARSERFKQLLLFSTTAPQYRLERISLITGRSLNDAKNRQDFQNALMILEYYPFSSTESR